MQLRGASERPPSQMFQYGEVCTIENLIGANNKALNAANYWNGRVVSIGISDSERKYLIVL